MAKVTRKEKIFLLEILKNVGDARGAAQWLEEDAAGTGSEKESEPRRRVEVLTNHGWLPIVGEDVTPGMRIRMFDPDGAPVQFSPGMPEQIIESKEPQPDGTFGYIGVVEAAQELT